MLCALPSPYKFLASIHVLSGLEQREVFGAKFFLQFVYLLGQLSSFLALFLLVGLVELITEIEDLAIGLGFSLIATDDADDLLCQFGGIGLLSLSKQRRRRNNQNPQDQQPVHKFPVIHKRPYRKKSLPCRGPGRQSHKTTGAFRQTRL